MRLYPPGFWPLSASVACERFGFFLLTSLLLMYLRERFALSAAQATDVLGSFVAATYLSPLVVGFATDGRMGVVRIAAVGYLVAATGYALLLADGAWPFGVGLTLIAVGAGAAKSAPQALATRILADSPDLRDAGLTLIYLLVNVSAVVGPVVGETVRAQLGWPAAFALSSLSLLVAWLILRTQSNKLRSAERAASRPISATDRDGRGSLATLLGLCLLSLIYSVTHMQASSTLLLWAQDHSDRRLLDWEMPVPYVVSLHALLVLGIAPLLARVLSRLHRMPGRPEIGIKIALGMAATGLAFVPMVVAAWLGSDGSLVGLRWLIACLALLSVAELLVGALGPSLVLRLAPREREGRWIGAWYGATALGFWLAGQAGMLWGHIPYTVFFAGLSVLAVVGVGIGMSVGRRTLRAGRSATLKRHR